MGPVMGSDTDPWAIGLPDLSVAATDGLSGRAAQPGR
jgi:hypothetical protein